MKMLLLSVILVLVTQHASGVGEIEEKEGIEGEESVVLPCEAPPDVTVKSVEWSRYELNPSTVHLRQTINNTERDVLKDQNPSYRTRTELQTDALKTGDVSLTLKTLRLPDRGMYRCIVRWGMGESKQTQVYLNIISKREGWFHSS
ncbi:programmed cell death 1 ligand 1-like [Dicentrarchus labrax]|uniref:programmed cell death 1 ligand 1-like n=1 Tax=Dicentrarchus labrax TaxID=13489 RepID=UPI0021F59F01|nr:programmed cell death 1 ligand 1-like [Dicentrarchus labrax]